MNEAERFAAAAIAFTWQHEPRFREHFWNRVCRFEGDATLTEKAEIFVEPYRWADLLITNPTRRGMFVYVVELKIHAPLSNIQNPAKQEFGLVDGYGSMFNANFGFPGEILGFVLLGAKPLSSRARPWNLPIRVQQRDWRDLVDDFPTTSVSKDLAISLGMIGIDAFPAAKVKNMKVDSRQREFAKADSILREAERCLSWPRGRSKREFSFENGYWYLGVELMISDTDPAKSLKNLVRPLGTCVAWFGYLGEEGGPPSLGVLFYCGSGESRDKTGSILRAKLRGYSIDATKPPEYNTFPLIVSARRHNLSSDCEWFRSVFEVFGLKLRQ